MGSPDIQAGCQAADQACAQHQLMADDFRVAGHLLRLEMGYWDQRIGAYLT